MQREEKNAFKSLGTGNRIATWLTYMSDVDYGGATVFTQMGVTLRPKRGAAAFWYNLFRNGEGDEMTRHAACPVLAGSKWGELCDLFMTSKLLDRRAALGANVSHAFATTPLYEYGLEDRTKYFIWTKYL